MVTPAWWQETAQEVIELIGTFRRRLDALPVSYKPDDTVLTEADIALQNMIINRIRELDPDSRIVAEEDREADQDPRPTDSIVWIVDPIDGTSQFVMPGAVEFCSVIARYLDGQPAEALVVAPELGVDRTPIVIAASMAEGVTINQDAFRSSIRELTGYASTTRSKNSPPSEVETRLLAKRYELKTRTTSQTLDMVRTALDLTTVSPHGRPFDLFHRRQQKVWDGAAGICLAKATGLTITDEQGEPLLPLSSELLGSANPILPSTVVGQPALTECVLGGAECSANLE